MPNRKTAALAPLATALMLMTGCGGTDNEPGPGGVTVGEAKALDDAAEMLESRDGKAAPDPASADQDQAKK